MNTFQQRMKQRISNYVWLVCKEEFLSFNTQRFCGELEFNFESEDSICVSFYEKCGKPERKCDSTSNKPESRCDKTSQIAEIKCDNTVLSLLRPVNLTQIKQSSHCPEKVPPDMVNHPYIVYDDAHNDDDAQKDDDSDDDPDYAPEAEDTSEEDTNEEVQVNQMQDVNSSSLGDGRDLYEGIAEYTLANGLPSDSSVGVKGEFSIKTEDHHNPVIPTKIFNCLQCKTSYLNITDFYKHNATHKGKKSYACTLCEMSYTCNSALTHHMRVHTGEKPYKCKQCDESFIRRDYLRRHMLLHRKETMYCDVDLENLDEDSKKDIPKLKLHSCNQCTYSCDNKYDLIHHRQNQHRESLHKCLECGKLFTRSFGLVKHMASFHNGPKHACSLCDATFVTTQLRTKHIKQDHNISVNIRLPRSQSDRIPHNNSRQQRSQSVRIPHNCKICDANYDTKAALNDHLLTHANFDIDANIDEDVNINEDNMLEDEQHTVPVESTQNSSLVENPVTVDVNDYGCTQCHYTCNSKYLLIRHVRKHTGEKPYKCAQCPKDFVTQGDLTSHAKRHTGVKPFQCRHLGCDKVFRTNRDMLKHARTHTDVKPFKCTQCGNRFRMKYHLTRHMIVHTGMYKFTCQICRNGFRFEKELVRHTNKAHPDAGDMSLKVESDMTVNKLYTCSVCNIKFARKSTFLLHMNSHTNYEDKKKKEYLCDICCKSFVRVDNLNNHRKKVHGIQIIESIIVNNLI